ncbi:MAG TPA: hypothetical protein VJQ56_11590, partial [Blastocatellia bacterium]|nr:hypothetical protein [Blastocatellia bacterium]
VGGVPGGPTGTPFDGFVAKLTLAADGDGDDTVATPAPLAPSNTSVPTNTAITFDWTDVTDASGLDGYHVQLNQRPDFVCCNDWQEVWIPNSEWVTSVRFSGAYYWRVQAADRSGNVSAWSPVQTFNSGAGVSTIFITPSTVQGGSSAQGTVSITSPAPSGGAVVSLRSSNTGVATVPSSVTIAQGNHQRNFTVSTRSVTAPTTVTITATYRNVSRSTTLTVSPPTPAPSAPALVSPANNAQLPVNQSITFTWNPASNAATYEIQIDDSSTFSTPFVASQTGLTQTQFARTFTSQRRYWWRVRGRNSAGTNGAWSSVRLFDIVGTTPPPASSPALSTLTLNPTSVLGGASSQGSITLTSAAPSGGAVVTLTSSNTTAATVPASITVAAGATGATFTVTTRSVSSSTPVTISAAYGGVTRTATLTVNAQTSPPPPSTDTVSIQRAEYSSSDRQLRVEATSTNSNAVLQCFVASTNQLIGTLRNEGGGRYRADFSWSTNPQSIRVRSNLGGSATRTVSLK